MTDKELIARLRSNIFGTGTTMLAADRIEALTAKVKLMDGLDVINGEKIEALTEQLTTARDDAKEAEAKALRAAADMTLGLSNARACRPAILAMIPKGGNDAKSDL